MAKLKKWISKNVNKFGASVKNKKIPFIHNVSDDNLNNNLF